MAGEKRSLETERLILRPYAEGDLDAMARLYDDPKVTALTKNGRCDRNRTAALLADYLETWRREGYGMRAMLLKPDRVYIGECGFFRHEATGRAALRYACFPDYWGQGLTREAVAATLDHAFAGAGMELILGFADQRNTASDRLMRKVGFSVESVSPVDGISVVAYKLSRAAYLRSRPAT